MWWRIAVWGWLFICIGRTGYWVTSICIIGIVNFNVGGSGCTWTKEVSIGDT